MCKYLRFSIGLVRRRMTYSQEKGWVSTGPLASATGVSTFSVLGTVWSLGASFAPFNWGAGSSAILSVELSAEYLRSCLHRMSSANWGSTVVSVESDERILLSSNRPDHHGQIQHQIGEIVIQNIDLPIDSHVLIRLIVKSCNHSGEGSSNTWGRDGLRSRSFTRT